MGRSSLGRAGRVQVQGAGKVKAKCRQALSPGSGSAAVFWQLRNVLSLP